MSNNIEDSWSNLYGAPQMNPRASNFIDPNADRMEFKKIHRKFREVHDRAVMRLVENSQRDPALYESMHTTQIPNGVQIDKFKVQYHLQESQNSRKAKKIFYVMDAQSGQILAEDLLIYESAYAIAKILNSGRSINDPKVNQIIENENAFYSHRKDAGKFKDGYNRASRMNLNEDADILYAKFQRAYDNAMYCKENAKRICESISIPTPQYDPRRLQQMGGQGVQGTMLPTGQFIPLNEGYDGPSGGVRSSSVPSSYVPPAFRKHIRD